MEVVICCGGFITGKFGGGFMDCEEVKEYMAEYVDGSLDPDTKEQVACHLDKCDICFDEVKALDGTIWRLKESGKGVKAPEYFMDRVEERIIGGYNPGAKRARRIFRRIVCALICASLAYACRVLYYNAPRIAMNVRYRAIAAVAPEKLYSGEHGTYGRKLDISSTDKGIKITATKIVADDLQTLVYFKMDRPGYRPYMRDAIGGNADSPGITPWMSEVPGGSGEFIFCTGPLKAKDKRLHISISNLYAYGADDSAWQSIDGRWELYIPVADMDIKPMKSRSYDIDYIVDLGGCAIKFKKFISAPSGSYLVYDFEKGDSFAGISVQSMSLQSAGKRLDMLMNYMDRMYVQVGGYACAYESLYPAKPENIRIDIPSCINTVMDAHRRISFDPDGSFPVEFDYLGNRLYINRLKTGVSDGLIRIELSEPKRARNYYRMTLLYDDQLKDIEETDYYVADEDGAEYDYDEIKRNSGKYAGRNLLLYPAKTIFTIEPDAGEGKKEISLTIISHSVIDRIDKTIRLDLKQ